MPTTNSTRSEVFVNTVQKSNRIRILKPAKDLEELPDENQDVFVKGLVERYAKNGGRLLRRVCSMLDTN